MMKATPISWSADGASDRIQTPSRTDATGWMVSTTEVIAAGRRGRLMLMSSQPDDLDAERQHEQPAVRGPGRHELDLAQRQPDGEGDDRGRQRGIEERAGRPAQVGVGAALDQDEAAVGEPGHEPQDHAQQRVLAVRT